MSNHIAAKKGEIAKAVLLPGDPLRAKFIAETFLEKPVCYNTVRNMLGFTGTYKGERVSVQGTGMGIPSISIYVNELFNDYGVKKAIRVGTAGSLQKEIKIRDVVLALTSSTDSSVNKNRFGGKNYAPVANFDLLKKAYEAAKSLKANVHVGGVLTSDIFYDEPDFWKIWARYGAMAVDMETTELYTLAAKFKRQALSILTISNSLVDGSQTTTAKERETTFKNMIEIALEAVRNGK
ncbi:MAG: purine-nucleoside phosphorylase [Elusimicrobiota bacterium]|jgi:purine-nucleoside phosphorylase|nr:purine-nucleoside phosphorylase [Elusimicrobiota bacterium]